MFASVKIRKKIMTNKKPNHYEKLQKQLNDTFRAKCREILGWTKDVEYHKINDKTPLTNAEIIALDYTLSKFGDILNETKF
jgi:hypothetical protein